MGSWTVQQHFTSADAVRRARSAPAIARRAHMVRLALLALSSMLAFSLMPETAIRAQTPSASTPIENIAQPPTNGESSLTATGTADDEAPTEDEASSTASLTADQVIHILQQNPDLLAEVKSEVADRLGTQVDASDISDQMLYSQITANADLRANITTFLRASGAANQQDVPASGFGTSVGTANAALLSAQRAPSAESDGSLAGRTARGSAAEDRSGLAATSRRPLAFGNNQGRGQEETHASTDIPKVIRQQAPYDLQSMRDLYTQLPQNSLPLKRFGSEMFLNRNSSAVGRGNSSPDISSDVPMGPDYVVGPGDALTINIWGGLTQSITRVIGRDGRILLPEAGSLDLAGLPLGRAEGLIEAALKKQYRDVQVAITVSHLRSVRVYVVGDVQRPGGYDISSLATPLSALYAAGGPTAVGSLRIVRHYRGEHLVEEVDLYDFLLHGVRTSIGHFESGDTLLVPPAGAQVAVSGAVRRPAIYELKASESTLAAVIADAGGFTASASLSHITIERIDGGQKRETVTLPAGGDQAAQADRDSIAAFQTRDGDRIHVSSILPYSQRAVYLEGHVVRPGRLPYTDGMRLSDVLPSYQDMLPEPSAHGEVIRLVPPDLHAETIEFDVPEVLIGNANINLQPFDTIRILGRYDVDAPNVTIQGEVLRPSTYPLSTGMTVAQLVRLAGGFKRAALLESADLTSYTIVDGNRVAGTVASVRVGSAVSGAEPGADVVLKPGDVLTVHQITGWNDIGQSITIDGQVRFPGVYGFQEGERLSSVLRRAGGLRDTAYPEGAVLVREQVRDLQEQSRQELIRQIETNSAAARLSPNLAAGGAGATLQLVKAQQDEVISDLKSHPPNGRLVVHISTDIASWANTSADIELRRGDVLTIPKRPSFVLITGQVYNATALTFTPGKSAGWYLSRAGGTNSAADRKDVFIIRANGSVIGRHSGGWFDADVVATRLDPGDVVVVPQKVIGSSLLWRNLLTTAQLASSLAITAAVSGL
jgi:protein involved in polysaccharide export with SLBB domain